MIRIKKTISLENFRSRNAGIVSSVNDNSGNIYAFSKDIALKADITNAYHTSNYGMFPSDVIITNTPLSGMGDVVSYSTLSEWYNFMKSYKSALKVEMNCGTKIYSSASEFNTYEDGYIDESYDERYAELGGDDGYLWLCDNVFVKFHIPIITASTQPDYVSNWKCDFLCFPDFIDWYAWFKKRHDLYSDITDYYEDCPNEEDCCDCDKYFSLGGNEMFERMEEWFSSLTFANIEKQTSSVTVNNTELFVDSDGNYYDIDSSSYKEVDIDEIKVIDFSSFIEIKFSLNAPIDDIGEMSLLAEEWENLTSYANEEKSGGEVVLYNGRDWVLNEDKDGYYYSNKYREGYFGNVEGLDDYEKEYMYDSQKAGALKKYYQSGNEEWDRLFFRYAGKHIEEFKKKSTSLFAYKDDVMVSNPTPMSMADTYDYIYSSNGYVLIDNSIYELFESDYILYDKIYLVNYVDKPSKINPYILYNGKRVFGVYKTNLYDRTKSNWVFNLTNVPCLYEGDDILIQTAKFIEYKGKYYMVSVDEGNYVTVGGVSYGLKTDYEIFYYYSEVFGNIVPFVDGEPMYYTFTSNDDDTERVATLTVDTFGINGYSALTEAQMTASTVENSSLHGYYIENETLYIVNPYNVYDTNFVTGETESKLDVFKSKITAYDDLGNELPGLFDPDRENTNIGFAQPKEGSPLGIPFEVGTVRHLEDVDFPLDYGNTSGCVIESIIIESGSTENVDLKFEVTLADYGTEYDGSFWENISENEGETSNTEEEKEGENQGDDDGYDVFDYVNDTDFTSYYWGDILSSIEYYTKDSFGNKVIGVKADCNKFDFVGSGTSEYICYKNYALGSGWLNCASSQSSVRSSIDMINFLIDTTDKYILDLSQEELYTRHGDLNSSEIYCDMEYYMGAIISREYSATTDENGDDLYYYGPYKVSYLDDGSNFNDIQKLDFSTRIGRGNEYNESHQHYHHHYGYGVRYQETCKVVQSYTSYALTDRFSYNVLYYDLERTTKEVEHYDISVETRVANFTTSMISYDTYVKPSGENTPARHDELTPEDLGGNADFAFFDETFVDDDGFLCSPVFREEYRFGISSLEKVKEGIYIDRGQAQSIDRHFKLLSCKSFDALERYGNGYFSIKDN